MATLRRPFLKKDIMTKTQLRHWKRLSIGLAKSCHPELTKARQKKLIASVTDCIDTLVWNIGLESISDWNGSNGSAVVCDAVSDFLEDHHYHVRASTQLPYRNRFRTQVSACVRAGFDVAVAQSTGVVGFTAGDLRAIFNNRPPKWVRNFFTPPLTTDVPNGAVLWI
jgi:hypothetical protein